ncbi:hypothetical protein [Synechococcus sp. CS-197]|uniref:hypothetical protein n=1 Tax=Synechococcus sp. CS-197 TaxID=2847985 RepID=UPI0001525420|nr:hypothetical protein [Synechococcus sp. CS-197]MCT0250552.1 hypothetical protein [Synechococcus sp. CS-197]PTT94872.1 hypothetical protein DBR45_50155 [Pseudomonas sp. HMWF031]CAK23335.1 Hypothetical protein SynWH7803_0909 [Synechococcus sp. WH 7803]
MKQLFAFAAFALCLAAPSTAAPIQHVKDDTPIGTELIIDENGQFLGRTPSGKMVNIELDNYDRWWLEKSDQEQSKWLDVYLAAVRSGVLQPGITFVQFMKVVMLKNLLLTDFTN